jgi:hypothetical protein
LCLWSNLVAGNKDTTDWPATFIAKKKINLFFFAPWVVAASKSALFLPCFVTLNVTRRTGLRLIEGSITAWFAMVRQAKCPTHKGEKEKKIILMDYKDNT